MEEKPQIDFDLAAKVLSNNASDAEIAKFEGLMQDESLKEEFAELEKLWLAADQKPTDIDAGWESIQSQINANNTGSSIFIRNSLRVAAVILVLFSLISVFWYLSQNQLETFKTQGQMASINLNDGTVINLAANSELVYPVEFNEDIRKVTLKGRGYFEVSNANEWPFEIETTSGKVTVVGTAFEVDATGEAVPLIVEVEEGIVEVAELDQSNMVQVTAGNKAVLTNEALTVSALTHPAPFFWRDKTIKFKRTALRDVVKSLDDLLNIKIKLEQESLENCELSVTFRDEVPETIMEVISQTLNLNLSKNGDTYLLSGEGC